MIADQELRGCLARLVERAFLEAIRARPSGNVYVAIADALMADSDALDEICEYRARQINAEVTE